MKALTYYNNIKQGHPTTLYQYMYYIGPIFNVSKGCPGLSSSILVSIYYMYRGLKVGRRTEATELTSADSCFNSGE